MREGFEHQPAVLTGRAHTDARDVAPGEAPFKAGAAFDAVRIQDVERTGLAQLAQGKPQDPQSERQAEGADQGLDGKLAGQVEAERHDDAGHGKGKAAKGEDEGAQARGGDEVASVRLGLRLAGGEQIHQADETDSPEEQDDDAAQHRVLAGLVGGEDEDAHGDEAEADQRHRQVFQHTHAPVSAPRKACRLVVWRGGPRQADGGRCCAGLPVLTPARRLL